MNGVGYESANATIVANNDIPWLQDTAAQDVWSRWAPTYRDVIILDAENRPIAVYNLTVHDLQSPAAFAELKALLLGAQ